MTTRYYYAADNSYSSPTSVGFANTWYVRVFDSRAARDDFVHKDIGLAARAITRREIPRYCHTPPRRSLA